MPSMNSKLLPFLAMMGAILSLCLGSSVAKQLFPVVGASGATALRVAFSALFLWIVWRPWRKPMPSRADWPLILLYGIVLGLMNWMFYQSIRTIPFGLAVAIELLGPLGVAFLSSRRRIDFVWIVVAVVGLALLLPIFNADTAKRLDPVGMLWALGAAVCWGTYIVIGKKAQHVPSALVLPIGLTVATLVIAPIGLAQAGMQLFTPQVLLIGAAVGIVSSAIPYTLEFFAIKRLPRETFGTLAAMEPAVAALVGWFALGEVLHGLQLVAIALVMAASVGTVFTSRVEVAGPPQ